MQDLVEHIHDEGEHLLCRYFDTEDLLDLDLLDDPH